MCRSANLTIASVIFYQVPAVLTLITSVGAVAINGMGLAGPGARVLVLASGAASLQTDSFYSGSVSATLELGNGGGTIAWAPRTYWMGALVVSGVATVSQDLADLVGLTVNSGAVLTVLSNGIYPNTMLQVAGSATING
jgi:hypothetical protein